MDENNQILDVTYGNFSCRLEGFEDSVETMKTVVSFFHELAGHERFMDVPPLAPDLNTLARLTEEETGQPVEIEGEGSAVSLRVRKDEAEGDLADEMAALEDELEDDFAEEELADEEAFAEEQVEAADETDEDETFDIEASVADKLERIRAVVDGEDDAQSDDYAEDLSEEPTASPAANPLSQRLADLAKRNAELAAADDAAEGVLDNLAETNEDASENLMDDRAEGVSEALSEEINAFAEDDDFAEIDDDIATALEAADDEVDASAEQNEMAETIEEESVEATAEEDLSDTIAEELEVEEMAEEVAPEADAEEDISSDRSPLLLTPNDAATDGDGDDDDFDLQKEVAKVEAEIAARQNNGMARHGLPRKVEDAMSRIMSQTDQHLNQPESRRHRDAFAQLKAAVAATEAARQLGDKGAETPDPDELFKDDLDSHDAEERSDASETPPLKLVPSQEVTPEADTEEAAPVADTSDTVTTEDVPAPASTKTRIIETPVEEAPQAEAKPLDAASERLRQIAALKESGGSAEENGFAEFADAHGATDLVDRMEAAGAYICFVEGEADFSRPQVMKVVQSASDQEITREDGLRSFGRLLRQARLVKLANGRFQIAENTQYRPDGDKAAQG